MVSMYSRVDTVLKKLLDGNDSKPKNITGLTAINKDEGRHGYDSLPGQT